MDSFTIFVVGFGAATLDCIFGLGWRRLLKINAAASPYKYVEVIYVYAYYDKSVHGVLLYMYALSSVSKEQRGKIVLIYGFLC